MLWIQLSGGNRERGRGRGGGMDGGGGGKETRVGVVKEGKVGTISQLPWELPLIDNGHNTQLQSNFQKL